MQNIELTTIDLRHYNCPQLFVQFKWQLKKLNIGNIRFICNRTQDLSDIKRYLAGQAYHYVLTEEGNFNFIEVHITDV
ncbi:sulfurtransferase TusA family protein [Pseudoalteromonas obscura]|uniref:sulfurtransferase TusA family protein n=1 Tax=Pseudoalteromonas obscura TaxID=3048491 RepID=UPI003A96D12E